MQHTGSTGVWCVRGMELRVVALLLLGLSVVVHCSAQQIAAGVDHTCGIFGSGILVCFGANDEPVVQMAYGDTESYVQVTSGDRISCALSKSDQVHCWQLSPYARRPDLELTPVVGDRWIEGVAGSSFIYALSNTGTVRCKGRNDNSQFNVPDLPAPAVAIAAGSAHACAVLNASTLGTDSNLICWGNNADNRLPASVPWRVASVSCGSRHTCALSTTGKVQCWGANDRNQAEVTGQNENTVFTSISIGGDHSCGLVAAGGAVRCWGDDSYGQAPAETIAPTVGNKIVQVSCGGQHCCAIQGPSLSLHCWGSNSNRQSSMAPAEYFMTSCSEGVCCALRIRDASLECWGFTLQQAHSTLSGLQIGVLRADPRIRRACVVSLDGDVYCLADDMPSTPVFVNATDVCINADLSGQVCARLKSGEIECRDILARYGNQPREDCIFAPALTDPTRNCVTSDSATPCTATPSDIGVTLYQSCGLPNPNFEPQTPHCCSLLRSGELRCTAPADPSREGTLKVPSQLAVQMAINAFDRCTLFASGTLRCWSFESSNLPGYFRYQSMLASDQRKPFRKVLGGLFGTNCGILRETAQALCWGFIFPEDRYESIFEVLAGSYDDVGVGFDHACGLLLNHTARCWGVNDLQQLSAPADVEFSSICSGNSFSCALRRDNGSVQCWGVDTDGVVRIPVFDNPWLELSCGDIFICGADAQRRLVCTGQQAPYNGQIVVLDEGPVFQVQANTFSAGVCAVNQAGRVQCFVGTELVASPSSTAPQIDFLARNGDYACGIARDGSTACTSSGFDPATAQEIKDFYNQGCFCPKASALSMARKGSYKLGSRSLPCAGSYSSAQGYVSPLCEGLCQAGKAGYGSETSICSVDCPPSFFCPAGSADPIACSTGYYCNTVSLAAPSALCPIRSYCPAGTDDPSATLCAAGRYSNRTGQTNSQCSGPCQEGYYCPEGSSSATQHPCGAVGLYCPSESDLPKVAQPGEITIGGSDATRTAVEPCPKGSQCAGGVATVCSPGFFSNETGSTLCLPCEPGRFNTARNSTTCSPCSNGTFSLGEAATRCGTCGYGSFYNPGTQACALCSVGKFSDVESATQCESCIAGRFMPLNGSSTCFDCVPGQNQSTNGRTSCEKCAAGYHAPAFAQRVCLPCGEGSYQPANGSNLCITCGPGRYMFENASTSDCLDCGEVPGAVCRGGVVTAEAGFFVYRSGSTLKSAPCKRQACGGGALQQQCGDFRQQSRNNLLCAECLPGYTEFQDRCVECSKVDWGLVFAVLAVTMAFVTMVYWRKSTATEADGFGIAVYFVQTTIMVQGSVVDWINVLSFINSDFKGTVSSRCLIPLKPFERLALELFEPVLFYALLLLLMAVHFVAAKLFSKLRQLVQNPAVHRFARLSFNTMSYKRTAIALILYIVSRLAQVTLRYLRCVEVDEALLVAYNPQIDCRSSTYASWRPILIVVLVLTVSIPIMIFVVAYRRRHQPHPSSMHKKLDSREMPPSNSPPYDDSVTSTVQLQSLQNFESSSNSASSSSSVRLSSWLAATSRALLRESARIMGLLR